jgi:hypothetical protein
VAVILVSELTVTRPTAPLNIALLAPVNLDPVILTAAPIVPDAGLNELIVDAAASAGTTPAVTSPAQTTTASTAAGNVANA